MRLPPTILLKGVANRFGMGYSPITRYRQAHEGETMNAYLTAARLASLKQYLNDCAAGIDTVIAWNAHKARTA